MPDIYSATTEGAEALAAATTETLVQLIGSTATKARIVAWGVSFDGTTAAAAPVLIRLAYQTTAGTSSGATEVPFDPDAPTANVTAFNSFTAEPSLGSIIEECYVHPQGGNFIREYAPGRGPVVDNATTSRIGLIANAAAIVNATAFIQWEE